MSELRPPPPPGKFVPNVGHLSAAAAGFPTRSLSPLRPTSTDNDSAKPTLQIYIPSHLQKDTVLGAETTDPSSPTPLPGPESAPPTEHPFANSTAKIEVIPHSSGGVSGIDIEEEARLYDELRRTAKHQLPPVPLNLRRRMSSPPPPSILSNDIFLADHTGSAGNSKAFAQDVGIAGWSSVGDAPPTSAGVKKSLKAAAHGNGSAYIVYDCVITTKEGTTIHILKRYTAFVELDTSLRRTIPRHLVLSLPPLPPKNFLARFRPAFLEHRRRRLQYYLASVLLHPEVGGVDAVKKWVIE